jgi:hypothetical protein
VEHPVEALPLREWLRPGARICILFTDITRATPNDRIIPWLLGYLEEAGVQREQITLLNQLGTHRPNTPEELEKMLTPAVVAGYRVINHEPENHAACVALGQTRTGTPAWINREAVEADVRIVTGFIEPHFFAGFSGGPKGIMPGVAHVETVMSNHGVHNIGDPRATFGICEGNPLWEELRDIALRAGPSFLLNVTLNDHRAMTGVFAGDLIAAHRAGREFVRSAAMQKVKEPFDVVVTTNSGYPLDMNLYQGVKGMSAAARIVAERGTIILAAECREGVPARSPLDRLLREKVATVPALRARLVAAYLMDAIVAADGLASSTPACATRRQIHCVVAWSEVGESDDGAFLVATIAFAYRTGDEAEAALVRLTEKQGDFDALGFAARPGTNRITRQTKLLVVRLDIETDLVLQALRHR